MKIKNIILFLVVACFIASPLYAKNNKNKQLPPGLQKNVAQGKALPPGWQKKLSKGAILDVDVYKHGKIVVPLDPLGLVTVRVDDKLLRVHKKTMEIVDILR